MHLQKSLLGLCWDHASQELFVATLGPCRGVKASCPGRTGLIWWKLSLNPSSLTFRSALCFEAVWDTSVNHSHLLYIIDYWNCLLIWTLHLCSQAPQKCFILVQILGVWSPLGFHSQKTQPNPNYSCQKESFKCRWKYCVLANISCQFDTPRVKESLLVLAWGHDCAFSWLLIGIGRPRPE